jgi:drug/metabolite transporter (DMT)-like permease
MVVGLGLVLLGSIAHAIWNVLAKRAGTSGATFVWLYSAIATPVLVLLLLFHAQATEDAVTSHWWAAVVSALLHTFYALVLQRSYAIADLGVVYPVARAGAPVLVALAGIALWSTETSPALWIGIACICIGVPLLSGIRPSSLQAGVAGAVGGAATAVTIAGYTLWDGYAVLHLDVDVLAYLAIGAVTQFGLLTLAITPQLRSIPNVVRSYWRLALPIAVLVPTSYGLVLLAQEHLPVEVVAAARSTSIITAAILGWWLLGERRTLRGVTGVAILTAGVTAVAFGS